MRFSRSAYFFQISKVSFISWPACTGASSSSCRTGSCRRPSPCRGCASRRPSAHGLPPSGSRMVTAYWQWYFEASLLVYVKTTHIVFVSFRSFSLFRTSSASGQFLISTDSIVTSSTFDVDLLRARLEGERPFELLDVRGPAAQPEPRRPRERGRRRSGMPKAMDALHLRPPYPERLDDLGPAFGPAPPRASRRASGGPASRPRRALPPRGRRGAGGRGRPRAAARRARGRSQGRWRGPSAGA